VLAQLYVNKHEENKIQFVNFVRHLLFIFYTLY